MKEILKDILEKQVELNNKFIDNWLEVLDVEKIKIAVITEVAEFFESVPKNWKWWRKNLDNNIENSYVEVVDVLHFAITLVAKYNYINNHQLDYQIENVEGIEFNSYPISIIESINSFLVVPTYSNLVILIYKLCEYGNLDINKIWDIYFEKNKINHKRIEGGYREGKYKGKDKEKINI